MGSKPKAPKQTEAQKAFERSQREALNKNIQDENRKRKALIRGNLGAATLLSGLPISGATSPGGGGASSGPGGGADSLSGGVLSGAPARSPAPASGSVPRPRRSLR